MSKESIARIHLVLEKIEYIEQIVQSVGGITKALEDKITSRAAILMHLTAIAEQFNKLKISNHSDILNYYNKDDLKGLYDVRTYIAHDYDGVNLAVIEWIIRYGLDIIKTISLKVIKEYEI